MKKYIKQLWLYLLCAALILTNVNAAVVGAESTYTFLTDKTTVGKYYFGTAENAISFLQQEYTQLYRYKKPEIESYVFINRCGRPYKTNNIDKKFRYIRECISEIYPDDDFSDITPHCLRHTFATVGVNAGVPIKSMQALLGHANTKTLLDTYMHIGQEDKRISINMIEENSTVKRFKGIENYKNELQHKWSISGQIAFISNFAQSKNSHKTTFRDLFYKIYNLSCIKSNS